MALPFPTTGINAKIRRKTWSFNELHPQGKKRVSSTRGSAGYQGTPPHMQNLSSSQILTPASLLASQHCVL